MRILFIGNSFTYYNTLPEVVAQLATSAGMSLETEMHAGSDKSLLDHWYDSDVVEKIRNGQWDYVVLQEHSLYALEEKEKMERAVERFVSLIESVGATPVLFATWARQHLPQTASEIQSYYAELGLRFNAMVIPVGSIWKKLFDKDGSLGLYKADRAHPTVLGTYVAAVVFCRYLLDIPIGNISSSFHPEDAIVVTIKEEVVSLLRSVLCDY